MCPKRMVFVITHRGEKFAGILPFTEIVTIDFQYGGGDDTTEHFREFLKNLYDADIVETGVEHMTRMNQENGFYDEVEDE